MDKGVEQSLFIEKDKTHWVTELWLRAHSTNGESGWTAPQMRALGITWPPPRGWMRRLVGAGIEDGQRAAFEEIGARHRFKRDAKQRAEAHRAGVAHG